MTSRRIVPLRIAAVTATSAVLCMMTAFPSPAADGEVQVVNTETVQVYTDATGAIDTQRIYEQLALTGTGSVDLRNPVETDGLRNLQGFGGYDVEEGEQVTSVDVDGKHSLRSVSNYTGDLPLEVSVQYFLDGEPVEPGDVVGESGELEVRYTVKNVTGTEQEVTFDDGHDGTVTKTVEVPIPMVGSLTTVAPPSFTDVRSDQANLAGDGKGGTKLSFTMTLFPPIGSDTAEFGYTATITDGVVPRASISALPVNPLESPSFKTAGESYKGGADTGVQLTDGAGQIDANLLKLRDGAAELLAGLIQLRDGAVQLEAGLAGEAAPGAARIASGAGELANGVRRIDDGAGQLASGSQRLAAGAGAARTGGHQLSEGLGRISGGLAQLADAKQGLPAAAGGAEKLKAGVDLLIAKLGSPDDPATLIGGLAALEGGLTELEAGAGRLHGGLQQVAQGLPAAKGGVDQVKAGLDAAIASGGGLDQLAFNLAGLKSKLCVASVATCTGPFDAMIAGVNKSKTDLTMASGALAQVSAGLQGAIIGLDTQLVPGAAALAAGLGEAKGGASALHAGSLQFREGMGQVGTGMTELADGVTAAVAGVVQLSQGAQEAHTGSTELTAGLDRLGSGAQQLSAGAGALSTGAGKAADGANRLSDGANQLSTGLGDAAVGSGRLAEGLQKAADGAPALEEGAQRLSDEGSSKLIDAGQATAQNYGEMYAILEAGAKRAQDEDMVYGAPEGAMGLAAYSYEIKGEDGEAGRNLARGLGGAALLAAGAGVFALRRRIV